jgi:hypothetical protein
MGIRIVCGCTHTWHLNSLTLNVVTMGRHQVCKMYMIKWLLIYKDPIHIMHFAKDVYLLQA